MKIAIIPARGGSKRIPNKNIVDFCGKPMIVWTIEAALESKLFDKVVVSTESVEIAEVARRSGAEVPFLRTQSYDDNTPVSKVTIDMLREMKALLNKEYDVVVQLMANCPLRRGTHILDSFANFKSKNLEFQLSCCRYGWQNPWWAFYLSPDCDPSPLFPDALRERSQDLRSLYCLSGAVWIADTHALLRAESFYGEGYKLFPVDWWAAIDIDDYDDLKLARAVYSVDVIR